MRRALILGVNGQDGSYLAGSLRRRGWFVHGVGRQPRSRWITSSESFAYHQLDVGNIEGLTSLLRDVGPEFIFHLAAIHGAAGFPYEDHWQAVHAVNTLSVHAVLEHLRRNAPDGAMIYNSSSKVFGTPPPSLVTETAPRVSSCIYSTTKNAATDLIHYYRAHHGVQASVSWAFNHESPRRPREYFIPCIVEILAKSICDSGFRGRIGTLQFSSDWGDAEEYMELTAGMAEISPGCDFVLASGTTLQAEKLVDKLFQAYGLDWRNHVIETHSLARPSPPVWHADLSTLRRHLDQTPRRSIVQVCDDILRINHPEAWQQGTGIPGRSPQQ